MTGTLRPPRGCPMASVWIRTRATKAGEKRYRVEYRLGGREIDTRFGGSFKTKRDATIRAAGSRRARRATRPRLGCSPAPSAESPTFAKRRAWRASRVDVTEGTRVLHRVALGRVLPVLGDEARRRARPSTTSPSSSSTLSPATARSARRSARRSSTSRRCSTTPASTPNPAARQADPAPARGAGRARAADRRPRRGRLRLLPSQHRLALLWLDWSGARVGDVDLTLVGDYDEPRRRVRLRAATTKTRARSGSSCPTCSPTRSRRRSRPARIRDPEARLFAERRRRRAPHRDREGVQAAGVPLFSPHDLRHRRISLLHLRACPWAEIGEFVGQRNLAVTAEHVHARPRRRSRARLRGAARAG